jgi:hypothetical protein
MVFIIIVLIIRYISLEFYHVNTNIFGIFFFKIEMFDLHVVSIFATGTGESVTTTPFFCKLRNTIYREIINIRTILTNTIKKRLNLYTKNNLLGWGSCLFLEFTFVFFTTNIQSPLPLGLERQIVHSDNLCRTNSQCILIIDNQKVCMYY